MRVGRSKGPCGYILGCHGAVGQRGEWTSCLHACRLWPPAEGTQSRDAGVRLPEEASEPTVSFWLWQLSRGSLCLGTLSGTSTQVASSREKGHQLLSMGGTKP